jgi:hypothetical protein
MASDRNFIIYRNKGDGSEPRHGVLPKAKNGKNSAHSISRVHEIPNNCIGFNVAVPEDPPSLKLQRAGGHPPGPGQHALTSAATGRLKRVGK